MNIRLKFTRCFLFISFIKSGLWSSGIMKDFNGKRISQFCSVVSESKQYRNILSRDNLISLIRLGLVGILAQIWIIVFFEFLGNSFLICDGVWFLKFSKAEIDFAKSEYQFYLLFQTHQWNWCEEWSYLLESQYNSPIGLSLLNGHPMISHITNRNQKALKLDRPILFINNSTSPFRFYLQLTRLVLSVYFLLLSA